MTIHELKVMLNIKDKSDDIEVILDKFNYSSKVLTLSFQLKFIYEYLIENPDKENRINPEFFKEEAKRLKNININLLIGENNDKTNSRNNG